MSENLVPFLFYFVRAFNRCFKELAFEGEEKCGADYFDRALEETQYRDYLKSRFSGVLDPGTCRGNK